MKAIVYENYGSPDVLRYTDVDQPTISDDEVLVRVHAASINQGDRFYLSGRPAIARLAFGLRRPKVTVLGRDIAGEVTAVGANVTTLRAGDDVFGEMNQKGFAEYVAAPARHLALKPPGVSYEQASTLPVAATTAGPDRFDVIVDLAGNHPLSRLRKLLTHHGVCVFSSGAGGPVLGPIPRLLAIVATGPVVRQNLRVLNIKRSIEDLTYLAGLIESGQLAPVIERTYPMSETAEAIRRLEAEHARGKVVLTA